MKFVGVSSCPTGIAHTYMAAEALEQAAKDAGHEMEVETQGSAGTIPLDPQTIADADGVVFAADLPVRDRERFAGKPIIDVGVKKAVHNPIEVMALAIAAVEEAQQNPAPAGTTHVAAPATKVTADASVGNKIRQWLMTGVSYMIPFVAAGGILIALGFLIGGDGVVAKLYGGEWEGVTYQSVVPAIDGGFSGGNDIFDLLSQAGFAGFLFILGKVAFFFLVPILSGFIAFAIADRPGLVPGIVGGRLASMIGAGFLGGLASGFVAGGIAYYLTRIKVPKGVRGVMPVVVIPLISTFVIGVVMLLVIGKPIAAAQEGLTNWLAGLTGSSGILLGVLLGLMMAFDMGGPVNKVAYTFAAGGLTTAIAAGDMAGPALQIMAAVMAAGMTPPLGLALATAVRGKLFTAAERENGLACWLLGLSFITEGAIPFAAANPLRVIPALMAGSAVTGGLVMAVHATVEAPHGGIWVIALVGKPLLYLLAIVIGTVITAAVTIALKGAQARKLAAADELVAA